MCYTTQVLPKIVAGSTQAHHWVCDNKQSVDCTCSFQNYVVDLLAKQTVPLSCYRLGPRKILLLRAVAQRQLRRQERMKPRVRQV